MSEGTPLARAIGYDSGVPLRSPRVRSLTPLVVALLTVVVALLVSPRAAAAFAPPPITGHVTDTAGKLSRDERLALDKKLEDYRLCSLHEIAVLVTGSLDGETVEDVAYKTFRAWQVGRKKEDDGVLLVIATSERKVRIETGKGVGGALTDVASAHILAANVKPHLKEGATFAAIDDGTTAIGAALGGCAMTAADAGAIAATRAAPTSGAPATPPAERSGAPDAPSAPSTASAAKGGSSDDGAQALFIVVDVVLAAAGLVALVFYAALRDRRLILPFPFAFVGAGFVTLGVGTATGSVVLGLVASHLTFLGVYLGLWRRVRTIHKAPIRPAPSGDSGWGAVDGGSSAHASSSSSLGASSSSTGSGGDSGSSGGYSGSGYSGGGGESGGGGASDSY